MLSKLQTELSCNNSEYASVLNTGTAICPWPIVQTKRAMDDLMQGQRLLVVTVDMSFIVDCKVYVKKTGNKLITCRQSSDKLYVVLEKGFNQC